MAYWFLMAAAVISLAGAAIHGILGGRLYMGNIRGSKLEPLTQSLSLVVWHVFTIFLLVSAATQAWLAYAPDARLAAWPIIAANLMGAALFIMLGLSGHARLMRMPGAYLMGASGALTWAGIWTGIG